MITSITTGVAQVFDSCYSYNMDENVASRFCLFSPCIFWVATPDCTYCVNSDTQTGQTCYEDEGHDASTNSGSRNCNGKNYCVPGYP